MKRIILALVLGATALTACTPIVREVRYPGGFAGSLLDKRTFDASRSKQLILFRATLILAMAADMGQFNVNGQDADGFAKLLASASEEINYAAADIWTVDYGLPCGVAGVALAKESTATDAGCAGFAENFESNLPRIEARIIKVMLAALPTDKARKFLDAVSKGDVLAAAWNALGVVVKSAGGLHFAFGRYRTGLETVAGSVENCASGGTFDARKDTVLMAAKCMGLSEDDLFENPHELKGDRVNATVRPRAFYMLMRGIAENCVSLPYAGKGTDLVASQKIRVTACNSIGFKPTPRPYRIHGDKIEATPGQPTEPEPAP